MIPGTNFVGTKWFLVPAVRWLDGVKIGGLSKSTGWDPLLLFFNSHPDISLSQPLTLLLVVQLTPVSVGSRCTQPPPPRLLPRPSQFSTSCLLHTTASTSVSTLSADRKQLHCCSVCVTRGCGEGGIVYVSASERDACLSQ